MNGRFETKETLKMAKFKVTSDTWADKPNVEFVEASGFYVSSLGAVLFYANEDRGAIRLALRDWDGVDRVEE